MGLSALFPFCLAMCSALAAPTAPTKYCDATTTICYSEFTTANNIAFRIAIPDTATSAPFDVLAQIVAPKTVGWAGIAWGGQMTYNPLTVAWPNGVGVTGSSRWATAHTAPAAYAGASYTVFPSSATNTTHWKVDVLAQGVSSWTDAAGKKASLNPAATAQRLAWASANRAVSQPASNTSSFPAHDSKGTFSVNLAEAKVANFTALVAALKGTA